jgi:hypothetical protein
MAKLLSISSIHSSPPGGSPTRPKPSSRGRSSQQRHRLAAAVSSRVKQRRDGTIHAEELEEEDDAGVPSRRCPASASCPASVVAAAPLAGLFHLRQRWQESDAAPAQLSPRGSGSPVRDPHLDDAPLSPWSPCIGSSQRSPLQQARRPGPGARRRRCHMERRRHPRRSTCMDALCPCSRPPPGLRAAALWEAVGGVRVGGPRMPVNIPDCIWPVPTAADLERVVGGCCGGVRALRVELVPAGGTTAGGWRSLDRALKNGQAVRSHRTPKLGKIYLVYFTVWNFFL